MRAVKEGAHAYQSILHGCRLYQYFETIARRSMEGAPLSGRVLINISAMTMVGAALLSSTVSARAADITFLCAGVLRTTAEELLPEFQKSTGHNVKVIYTSIGYITQRVRNGEAADLAIVSPQQWEDLKSVGKIDPNARVVIARVGAGMFVKRGAAKPDISTVEAFKRALLNAKFIALIDPAAGGQVANYAPRLFERLGISAELKPKIQLVGGGGGVAPVEPVIKGDAEIGLTTISEIIQFQPAIELVGPFPPEIQIFFGLTGAIPANARESAAARALLDFFTSPRAISILKSKGLEPG